MAPGRCSEMRSIVPVQPIPNQTFQIQLAGQACTINIYQLAYGLFMDLYVGNQQIVAGIVCQNLNRIVRKAYLGFTGDFVWLDTQNGEDGDDPIYTGLGTRFLLIYGELKNDLPIRTS